jgi:hypothetical protein
MAIFGFGRDRAAVADPAAGQVYVERRPGESTESFEARLAAAAKERERRFATGTTRRARPIEPPPPAARARAERPPRRRSGHAGMNVLGFLVVLVAAVGALWLVLAAREGSFAAGGAVVDRKIAELAHPARLAANQAVDRTGEAVQTAGQNLEVQGQRIRESAPTP